MRAPANAIFLASFSILPACDSSNDLATGSAEGFDGSAQFPDGGVEGGTFMATHTREAGPVEDACRRDVSLTAVTLGEPQPFDLVIVADHSQSLAWSRDELSTGLRTLLADVKGQAVRIFILTPTQYGASSAAAQMPLSGDSVVAWQDPQTLKPYTNEMTDFVHTCTDPTSGASIHCPSSKGPTPYDEVGTWQFKMPLPVATLTPTQTDAEFAAQQQAVADAILAIGGTGSPREQPLCSLSRYVTQSAAALPKNVVFLIISDEDDVSTPAECLAGYNASIKVQKTESGSTPCSSNCDTYRYSMVGDYPWKGFTLHCAAFDDQGHPIAGTEKVQYVSQAGDGTCAPGPCTADETKQIAPFCDKGLTLVSCDRGCTTGETRCTVDLTDGAVNPCTQSFTIASGTYANLPAYCAAHVTGSGWRNCSGGGLDIQYAESTSSTFSPNRLMSGTTTADIGAYFKSKADVAFGSGSYVVEGIVFDAAFACTLGSGQSYATNLAAVIGDRSRLFPLCESYAPALDGVFRFAQALIQTEFPVALKWDEHITAVYVIGKDGSERKLADTQFDYDGATLVIDRASLGATDAKLRVEVISDCRPRVH